MMIAHYPINCGIYLFTYLFHVYLFCFFILQSRKSDFQSAGRAHLYGCIQ